MSKDQKSTSVVEDESKYRKKPKETTECQELKNIKYKSMLLSGQNTVLNPTQNSSSIDKILENESSLNKKEPWNKLDKTIKVQKINEYVENCIMNKFTLSDLEVVSVKQYLIQSLDRIKLQRAKDVDYNKESGEIKCIPSFGFNQKTRKFTLKRCEKRVSTLKSLSAPYNSKKNREKKKEKMTRNKTEKIDTKNT